MIPKFTWKSKWVFHGGKSTHARSDISEFLVHRTCEHMELFSFMFPGLGCFNTQQQVAGMSLIHEGHWPAFTTFLEILLSLG